MLKPEKIGKFGKLYNADCLQVMKEMEDNSVTGICCDPPAGIAFMNKNWDSNKGHRDKWISWMTEVMTKALRVLKPGGMAFVWAIPRTAHWTAMAMEDAGFFVKDKIYHIQGQGFPKSTNISAKIDQKLGLEREVVGKREHPTLKDKSKVNRQESSQYHASNPIADEWDITTPASDQAKLFDGYGSALKPAAEEWIVAMKPNDGSFTDNALKWGIAGINVDAGRIGGVPHHNYGRTCAGGMFTGKSDTPINTPSQGRYPANLILQHSPDCVRIGEKKVKGSGTSKTFHEAYDGESTTKFLRGVSHPGNQHADENGNETIEEWDCSPSCPIRQMNEQGGITKSGGPRKVESGPNFKNKIFGNGMGGCENQTNRRQDVGFVSRYFKNLPPETPRFIYQSKASRAEREKGCENIPVKECQTGCGGAMPIDDQGKDRDRFKKVASNIHPTVKSLSLIKYLCQLLKMPTNTLILDMFAGSGTLGVACEQLKIPYLLIEKEEEYCEIIRARVVAANEPDRPAKRKKIVKSTNTLIPWEEITNDQNA